MIDQEWLYAIIFSFARVSAFFFFLPFLGANYVPTISKIAMALAISLAVSNQMQGIVISNNVEFVAQIALQVFLGWALAMVVDVIFSIPKMAGSIIDFDMGFSAGMIVDPSNGQQTTLISNLLYLMFAVVFLLSGGLDALVYSISYSFKFTSISFFEAGLTMTEIFIAVFGFAITTMITLALPLMIAIFCVNFMVLILAKSAPQLNIFMNMFGIKIAVGFLFLITMLPFIANFFESLNEQLIEKFLEAIDAMVKR